MVFLLPLNNGLQLFLKHHVSRWHDPNRIKAGKFTHARVLGDDLRVRTEPTRHDALQPLIVYIAFCSNRINLVIMFPSPYNDVLLFPNFRPGSIVCREI